MAAVLAVLVQG